MDYDVIIIGAGVIGCAIARELTKYNVKVCVLEKDEDVCSGTSKANSGIVHAGYDAKTGTLKARLNVRGAEMIRHLSKELDFPFKENGSMVVCFTDEESKANGEPGEELLERRKSLSDLLQRGEANGVKGLRIISGDEARSIEPGLSSDVDSALLVPTGGIVCPFLMTIAFAENAAVNGAEFRLLSEALDISDDENGYTVKVRSSKTGEVSSVTGKAVINAAGVYADVFHNIITERHPESGAERLHITPRRGEYVLMDHDAADIVSHTIFQLPTVKGKGVLVTPTVHGNLMVGPNADALDDKEDNMTTGRGMAEIKEKALMSVPGLQYNKTITTFAGIRATEDGKDFVIGEPVPGFFDAAGIESPGLSSAPAIGEMVAEMAAAYIAGDSGAESIRKDDADFISVRKGTVKPAELSAEERNELIRQMPEYGRIVCRCENVTEGEIIDAIRRPVGARSLDGIKRRVRQGMGRCQAGFCTPRAIEILARELGIPEEEVCKNMPGSELLIRE